MLNYSNFLLQNLKFYSSCSKYWRIRTLIYIFSFKFEYSPEGFTVILYRNSNVSDITNVTLDVTLNSSEMAVLALLKQRPNQTRTELASKTSKTVRTVQRALDSLRKK